MTDQQFLASIGVGIDESGVSRSQTIPLTSGTRGRFCLFRESGIAEPSPTFPYGAVAVQSLQYDIITGNQYDLFTHPPDTPDPN